MLHLADFTAHKQLECFADAWMEQAFVADTFQAMLFSCLFKESLFLETMFAIGSSLLYILFQFT